MKFKLFSVVVGTPACVASCPFCVSGEVPSKQNMCCPDVNWRNFKIAGEISPPANNGKGSLFGKFV